MSAVHVKTVERAHAYTSSKVPWQLEFEFKPRRAKSGVGARLFHYLSGGGMGTFGRTVLQEEIDRRQNRFLWIAGLVAVLWCVAYFL